MPGEEGGVRCERRGRRLEEEEPAAALDSLASCSFLDGARARREEAREVEGAAEAAAEAA
jgi:hypothetical protein